MPAYVSLPDGSRTESTETLVEIPAGLDVRSIRVSWAEVSLFDADGVESVLVTRGMFPGAGMHVSFADHVSIAT